MAQITETKGWIQCCRSPNEFIEWVLATLHPQVYTSGLGDCQEHAVWWWEVQQEDKSRDKSGTIYLQEEPLTGFFSTAPSFTFY